MPSNSLFTYFLCVDFSLLLKICYNLCNEKLFIRFIVCVSLLLLFGGYRMPMCGCGQVACVARFFRHFLTLAILLYYGGSSVTK